MDDFRLIDTVPLDGTPVEVMADHAGCFVMVRNPSGTNALVSPRPTADTS